MRKIKIVRCEICSVEFPSVGLDSHLKHKHKITSKEYKLKYITIDKTDYKYECLICNEKYQSERYLSHHVRIEHKLTKKDYIKKYYFKNVKQLCLCGCNNEVKILGQYPYKRLYLSGHGGKHMNGMKGKVHKSESKTKMSSSAIKRGFGKRDGKISNIEKKFIDFLQKNSIPYIYQYETDFGIVDFYLPETNTLIEIDGVYWHPPIKENLNFNQLSNFINDERKNRNIKNLIRIKDCELDKINSLGDIFKYSAVSYEVEYDQVLINKDFFKEYKRLKGKDILEEKIQILVKFCRLFIEDYPYPKKNFEFDVISKKIKNNIKHKIINNTFDNNISNVGVTELKSIFKNYWKSSYKNNKSPYEIFNNDQDLKKIISNRIGVERDEYFDFSLKIINTAMSVLRYSISFFKPQVAANIYSYFLTNTENPTVIDPCAGFGGRLLGFKSIYPNGKYIGIEPNKETFNYLVELSNLIGLGGIELYNMTSEEFIKNNNVIDVDLTFTSIPYFDKEEYCGLGIKYNSFNDWENSFISSLLLYPNLLVNLPLDLEKVFSKKDYETYYLKNNTSNFNKTKKSKNELILKF